MARLTAEQRKLKILEAALAEFAEKGPEGARIRDIAARSGNSETLIYRHFQNKEALYAACQHHLHSPHPALDDVSEAMARGDDRAVLEGLAEHMLAHARKDPRIMRLQLYGVLARLRDENPRESKSDPVRKSRVEAALAGYLKQASDQGRLTVPDPALSAKLFTYLIFMCAADCQLGLTPTPPDMDESVLAARLADHFLRGLLPRTP